MLLVLAGEVMGDERREGETRTRLLEAAADVFAEQGFRSARIRDICRKAGANVAAVNYHFRDKQGLYEAVLRYAFAGLPAVELPQPSGRGARSSEHLLRGFVRSFLAQLLGEGREALYLRLISHELLEPTSALQGIIEEGMQPQVDALLDIVRRLLGPAADRRLVRRCVGSVLGQCLYFQFARPVILATGLESALRPALIEELADHIAEFSLSAIKRLRRRNRHH